MIRKFAKYSLLPMLACVLLLASCVDDDVVKNGEQYQVIPDIPVTVPLKIQLSGSKVASRAAQSDEAERTINTIYVIAFKPLKGLDASDEEWVVDNAKTFNIGKVVEYMDNVDNNISSNPLEDTGTGDKTFPMTTGYRKIYAIGNPQSGAGTLTTEELAKVKTLADLKNLESLLRDKQSIERIYFKMSGRAITNDGSDVLTVTSDKGGSIKEEYNIVLRRVDARITFRIKGINGITFTPEYYHVMNIPGGTYVFPKEKTDNISDDTWDSHSGGYIDGYRTSDFSVASDDKDITVFEFYMCENRHNPKKRITAAEKTAEKGTLNNTLYSLREKEEKIELNPAKENQKIENGDFIYPNDHSTYIVLGGTVTGTREENGETQQLYAKVTYTIHLGNTGKKTDNNSDWLNDEELVNNYDVERNTHYTYNVTVAGVEKIIVEVDKDDEQEPGAEGDVILTQGELVTLDSHYSRFRMTLNKKDILDGLSWSVTTPFQRGLKVFIPYEKEGATGWYVDDEGKKYGLSPNTLSLNDYKWVKFAINKECELSQKAINSGAKITTDNVIKFPGEQAYNGGNLDTPAPIVGGEYVSTSYYDRVKLYDVNQLLNFLYNEAVKDGDNEEGSTIFEGSGVNRNVTITVFIDEYYYIYDPTKYFYRKPIGVDEEKNEDGSFIIGNEVDLTLWKRTVNSENRLLNICKEGSKYSLDGQSSVSRSVYTISQNPIYTFYNPKIADLKTAWGVEARLETKFLRIVPSGISEDNFVARFEDEPTNNQDTRKANSLDNGRSNQLKVLGKDIDKSSLRWDAVLNTDISEVGGLLLPQYKSVWYACLLRNRDLNGDDVIDASEVRWYLASIDQLTDMWIGEGGITAAKLYQAEIQEGWIPGTIKEGETRVHVASSSYFTGAASENNGQTNIPTNPWVIWAEESASRGSAIGSGNYVKPDGITEFSYRCVRNLGLSSAERSNAALDDYLTTGTSSYTTTENKTYNEVTIDISRMVDNCIRPSTGGNTVLPNHNERDVSNNNRPPLTLAIICDNVNGDTQYFPQTNGITVSDGWTWTRTSQNEISNRPCPLGYRVPNQREFMLIYTTYPEIVNKYQTLLTKTAFSYQTSSIIGGSNSACFIYDKGGNLYLSGASATGYVRCVRDATNNSGSN